MDAMVFRILTYVKKLIGDHFEAIVLRCRIWKTDYAAGSPTAEESYIHYGLFEDFI